ncbi:synaptotagmin-6-like [Acanthaster planci]|uniref:Synaptotagmin-6-like n=1 Tax=Acanthaster planci TaxID=133434 RepID=A0A8B8A844_ACAPL|nr:synaptotagmin-6-like [Acanthaster planci]XP_022112240.1 synaptotagmin-6-like [Acanthaster planci]XP_022112241.1 synaptotagmin-6-like [Acanthaster planci]
MVAAVVIGVVCGAGVALMVVVPMILYKYTNCCASCKKKHKDHEAQKKVAMAKPTQEFYIPSERVPVQPGVVAMQTQTPLGSSRPDLRQLSHSRHSLGPPSEADRRSLTSESSIGGSFESDIGAVQPELYARTNEVVVLKGAEAEGGADTAKKKCNRGRLHVKLKYDFNTSDFVVRLIEAEDLPAMDFGGTSDPYVKLSLEPDRDKRIKQSNVQRKTLNPTFNERFKFPMTFEETQAKTLRMNVYDFDKFSRHDAIGEVSITLADLDVSREVDVWSDLEDPQARHGSLGDLLFSLSYLPTAERLTIVIMKARNLKTMDISGSADPFVKVTLIQGGKRFKKKKTTVKKNSCDPVWNEAIIFNVPASALKTCCLEIMVVDYDLLGQSGKMGMVLVGEECSGLGKTHWNDMTQSPRKPVAMWHTLQD